MHCEIFAASAYPLQTAYRYRDAMFPHMNENYYIILCVHDVPNTVWPNSPSYPHAEPEPHQVITINGRGGQFYPQVNKQKKKLDFS